MKDYSDVVQLMEEDGATGAGSKMAPCSHASGNLVSGSSAFCQQEPSTTPASSFDEVSHEKR